MTPTTVLHVPHASNLIPDDLRRSFMLTDDQLRRELAATTDHFTDRLFALPGDIAEAVMYPVSRLVVDPERYPFDEQEPMAVRGMGAVYLRTSWGGTLRAEPAAEERESLMSRFYVPHHAALEAAVSRSLAANGACLIIDCHSFPSQARSFELDPEAPRPDIDLGTDSFHTPLWLIDAARLAFSRGRFSICLNRPYAGTMVPAAFHRKNPKVLSIMVELNRRLYMHEDTGQASLEFEPLRLRLAGALEDLIWEVGRRLSSS